MLITYPITHHRLTGSIFIVEKDGDISNFEFYFHECTFCGASVCWEICGLGGLCLMRGAEIEVTFGKPLQEIWTWLGHQLLTSSYKRKCEGI